MFCSLYRILGPVKLTTDYVCIYKPYQILLTFEIVIVETEYSYLLWWNTLIETDMLVI